MSASLLDHGTRRLRDSAIVPRGEHDTALGRDRRIFALLSEHARAVGAGDLDAAARVAQELAAIALEQSAPRARPMLVVGRGSASFCVNGGARIDLRRRRPLRLVLERLVGHRIDQPGVAVASSDLVAAGWPGETIRPTSAASRLYVTIHGLRELGLRDAIFAQDGGYLLDPTLDVHVDLT